MLMKKITRLDKFGLQEYIKGQNNEFWPLNKLKVQKDWLTKE